MKIKEELNYKLEKVNELQKNHWKSFYEHNTVPHEPSTFSILVNDYIKKTNGIADGKLIELGCGNGRDATFFASNGFNVHAVDLSENIIINLQNKFSNFPNIKFIHGDFTKLKFIDGVKNYKYEYAYSRFTLHAIPKVDADNALLWVSQNLVKGGYLFIEARSTKSSLYGKGEQVEKDAFIYDHYRRFIRKEELIMELKILNFEITYEIETNGVAVYKDDDPVVVRIFAKKIGDNE